MNGENQSGPRSNLSPERRLVYRFLELPHYRQERIAEDLGLVQDNEAGWPCRLDFKRARDGGHLEKLWDAIQAVRGDEEGTTNPFIGK